MSVMGGLMSKGKTEVTEKLRREVNKVVQGYVDQGVAEVVPGVVFIDEVCLSSFPCHHCLTSCLAGSYARY